MEKPNFASILFSRITDLPLLALHADIRKQNVFKKSGS